MARKGVKKKGNLYLLPGNENFRIRPDIIPDLKKYLWEGDDLWLCSEVLYELQMYVAAYEEINPYHSDIMAKLNEARFYLDYLADSIDE